MIASLLADFVVLLHVAFVVFALAGALLVVRWPRLVWLHVPAVAWAGLVELAGWPCPLTPLEISFREAGGTTGYDASFVDRYLVPVLYPADLTREVQMALGVFVLALNVGLYAWVFRGVAARRRIRA